MAAAAAELDQSLSTMYVIVVGVCEGRRKVGVYEGMKWRCWGGRDGGWWIGTKCAERI